MMANDLFHCDCGHEFKPEGTAKALLERVLSGKMPLAMIECPFCKEYTPVEVPGREQECEQDFRCPVKTCSGWVSEVEDDDSTFYGCGECGHVWADRSSLDEAISEIVKNLKYRRKVYVKSGDEFLLKLMCSIDTGLVTYRHYIPWCDAVIAEENEPPNWMLDLTLTKYPPKAVELLSSEAYNRFQEQWKPDQYGDFWICCQYLRYLRKEISWATFLKEAGDYADVNWAGWDCEEFYRLLNYYEIDDFSSSSEKNQAEYFKEAFDEVIQEGSAFYEPFKEWFFKYKQKM